MNIRIFAVCISWDLVEQSKSYIPTWLNKANIDNKVFFKYNADDFTSLQFSVKRNGKTKILQEGDYIINMDDEIIGLKKKEFENILHLISKI